MYVTYVHFAATCVMGKKEEESKENSLLMVFPSLSPTTVCTALQTSSVNRSKLLAPQTQDAQGDHRGAVGRRGDVGGVVIWGCHLAMTFLAEPSGSLSITSPLAELPALHPVTV